MKITRRAVLRLTGAAAASLALSSCSASGSAILGSNFSSWLQQTLGISSSGAASSAASSEDMVASSLAAGEQPAASLAALPAYDADPLTGEAKRSNGRIVGVMVNNISNTSRQNARPQRGLSSADLLIECKVEGGITRFCAVFHDADSIPEIGPLRSGRDQFLQLLMPYQALYYHDGESAACTKFIGSYGLKNLEGRVRTGTKRKRVRIGRKFVEPRLVILYVAHERLGQFERGALLASGVGCSARRCDDVFDEAVHSGIEGRVRRHHAVAVEGGLCSRANGFRYILLRESPLFSTLREDTACCGIKQAAFIRILPDFLKGQLRTAFGQQCRIAEAVHSPANGVENLLNADAPVLVGVKQFQRPCAGQFPVRPALPVLFS